MDRDPSSHQVLLQILHLYCLVCSALPKFLVSKFQRKVRWEQNDQEGQKSWSFSSKRVVVVPPAKTGWVMLLHFPCGSRKTLMQELWRLHTWSRSAPGYLGPWLLCFSFLYVKWRRRSKQKFETQAHTHIWVWVHVCIHGAFVHHFRCQINAWTPQKGNPEPCLWLYFLNFRHSNGL